MRTIRSITALLLSFVLAGCALTRQPCEGTLACAWQKPWRQGAMLGAATGAFAGGTAFGAAATNGAVGENDDESRAIAIASGVVGGALVGAVVGHLWLDKPAPVRRRPRHTTRTASRKAPVSQPQKPILVLSGATFDFDSAHLNEAGREALKATLRSLRKNPDVRIAVEGHTDNVGPDTYNQILSKRRAEDVKRYLVDAGIAPGRIQTRGLGSSKPVADNTSREGRAKNRRVEIRKLD